MSNLYSAFSAILKSVEQWIKHIGSNLDKTHNHKHHIWLIKPDSTRYFESDKIIDYFDKLG